LPRSGFCTGTGDGVLVVRLYVRLRPQGNPLARYLPALELIDRQGGGGDVSGLDGFIQAVQAAGRSDPLFRQAQDRLADELYFAPSQRLAKALGFRWAAACGQASLRTLNRVRPPLAAGGYSSTPTCWHRPPFAPPGWR
jgi:chitosanase